VTSDIHLTATHRRSALLPALLEIQQTEGYISREAIHDLSHTLAIAEAEIYGVVSFYSMLHANETGSRIVSICCDPVCGMAGSDQLLAETDAAVTARGLDWRIERTTCLGLCEHAPAAVVAEIGKPPCQITSATPATLLAATPASPRTASAIQGDGLFLQDHQSYTGGPSLKAYGTYSALRHALHNSRADLIETIRKSRLSGRGGAAFPAAIKWQAVAEHGDQPHYIVCNGDESEPGTFKDRTLMETLPHLVLEGMAIAAYAVGAAHGIVFIRGEYPLATERMRQAIDEAESAGLLGSGIHGTDFSLTLEVHRGAGAYICGEETALFEAIEGKRGYPRIKPPFPTQSGLFGKPTLIHNVETLASIPAIMLRGAEWFASIGTEHTPGQKLLAVSGHVLRPGVYEIEPGLSLSALLEGPCGGFVGQPHALLIGGASGAFLPAAALDTRISIEDLRARGTTLGSGAIMVFNSTVDLKDVLRRIASFFAHESCGKCFPCQLGTQHQLDLLMEPDWTPATAERLMAVGQTMHDTSLCGLGQTASSAIGSALKIWPELISSEVHHA
jgi:NADH-quinone oxidoreductase subunit F